MHQWPVPDRQLVVENDQVRLKPVNFVVDVAELFNAAAFATNGEDIFQYSLATGPFYTFEEFSAYLTRKLSAESELTLSVLSKRLNRLVGCVSLLNIRADHGSVEVGSIWYCKAAQRSEINTNAMYLLFGYVFDSLAYRRLEWKCNNQNQASKQAALRLGFSAEGIFRNHFWDKGKNRDTAWYSIIDAEWPAVKQRFQDHLLIR